MRSLRLPVWKGRTCVRPRAVSRPPWTPSWRGFEHQLDELYKADALDVDSDIRVMETMLHRDTASVEKDFGLGAAAQKKEKS